MSNISHNKGRLKEKEGLRNEPSIEKEIEKIV